MAVIHDTTGAYILSIDSAGVASVKTAQISTAAALADAFANPTVGHIGAASFLFNGVTWDRNRNNANQTVEASAARTATVAGATVTNFNSSGAVITISVTAASGTTPTLVAKLQFSPDNGTTWFDYDSKVVTATISAVGTYILKVYPGLTAEVANNAVGLPLPRTFRMYYTIGGTTPSFTFTTFVSFID